MIIIVFEQSAGELKPSVKLFLPSAQPYPPPLTTPPKERKNDWPVRDLTDFAIVNYFNKVIINYKIIIENYKL